MMKDKEQMISELKDAYSRHFGCAPEAAARVSARMRESVVCMFIF